MNKRFSVLFILLAFMLTACYSLQFNNKSAKAEGDNVLNVKSQCAYLVDSDSNTVIYAQNENERRPIASMCKIMTLLLSFEAIDNGDLTLDSTVVVSENASNMGGSQVFLESNAEYKVKDLIKSIVVASANDASVAMAETVAGSEENFVAKMNERAKSLSMNDTVFVNCTGLPKAGQFSTAKDVSLMFKELIKHKEYFLFSNIWMDEIEHPEGRKTEISNTNKLIRFYEGCDSGKTGYTSEAGHCVCCSAERGGLRFVSVIIKAPDSKTRFKDASDMLNFGFNNYSNKTVLDNKPIDENIKVENGKKDYISVSPESELKLLCKKGEKRSVEIEFEPIEKVVAPVNKGDVIGKISVYENNVLIATVNAISDEDVESATFSDHIKSIIEDWNLISIKNN